MRRPLLGLLLASSLLSMVAARPVLAEPPPAPLTPFPAPLAPSSAPAASPIAPATWSAPLAGTRRRSAGAMVGGIVLTSLGVIGMAVGTASYVDAVGGCREVNVGGSLVRENCNNSGAKLFGMTTLLVSASGAAVGVPLWIYGAEKVALSPEDEAPIHAAAVIVGPASAALRVTF
jgi:hypothetical protein